MCLADRVLVYGDCAVNPKPNPEQLADIAISSAETAAVFGIEPRIAMLSYSTGTSGKGTDVDAVREATEAVRETYIKEVNQGEMITWGVRGLYRHVEEPVPANVTFFNLYFKDDGNVVNGSDF